MKSRGRVATHFMVQHVADSARIGRRFCVFSNKFATVVFLRNENTQYEESSFQITKALRHRSHRCWYRKRCRCRGRYLELRAGGPDVWYRSMANHGEYRSLQRKTLAVYTREGLGVDRRACTALDAN